MTREEQIVEAAKAREKETGFGELVKSTVSRGVNSAYGIGFLEGAEWADRTMLDKACEWLDNNLPLYWGEVNANNTERFIRIFKQAMEEHEQ